MYVNLTPAAQYRVGTLSADNVNSREGRGRAEGGLVIYTTRHPDSGWVMMVIAGSFCYLHFLVVKKKLFLLFFFFFPPQSLGVGVSLYRAPPTLIWDSAKHVFRRSPILPTTGRRSDRSAVSARCDTVTTAKTTGGGTVVNGKIVYDDDGPFFTSALLRQGD